MFKIGDKVICIDNFLTKGLSYNKTYEVLNVIKVESALGDDLLIKVINDKNNHNHYSSKRFKLDIKQKRKEKLKEICLKSEIE